MENCFVKFVQASDSDSQKARPSSCVNSYFKNCILGYYVKSSAYSWTDYCKLNRSCTAYNCIGLGSHDTNIFSDIAYKNNTNTWIGTDGSSIFKSYKDYSSGGIISDSEAFELTDEAKAKYLGVDGTQVGIHGGNLPYNEQPSTPQITKCNVAAKSTADGKLSVEIEVKAAEY